MSHSFAPLADKMRPTSLDDYVGQQHLVGAGQSLRIALEAGQIHSMILWGPPGTGKTTLARLVAHYCDARFETLSAVLAGVKDVRAVVERAESNAQLGEHTILFVDEVHRFNKAQQDAFLPFVENGTFTFIGATTENPSFELNNALLSRARVYVLQALTEADLLGLLDRAVATHYSSLSLDDEAREMIAKAADGDARRALGLLEIASDFQQDQCITIEAAKLAIGDSYRRFDKGGEAFYDQISALHKSVRGSNPDASLYWMCRMLDGGCDPVYIARRVVRMASEDIGNADPRALRIALDAWETQTRLGSPEGELTLAQAVVYLACAAKSNAVYNGYKSALRRVKETGSLEVPMHLRNAPTSLMKDLGYGEDYRYAHNEPDAYAAGATYLPDELQGDRYYEPVERGLEIRIAEKLARLRALDEAAD